jgi:hypothetical protein
MLVDNSHLKTGSNVISDAKRVTVGAVYILIALVFAVCIIS